MKHINNNLLPKIFLVVSVLSLAFAKDGQSQNGVGVKAPKGAEVFFDGTREMLDAKWTYWKGPRLSASLPIKWQVVKDPVDKGTALNSNDPASAGGLYGAADIVTKKEFRDFRAHVEFLVTKPGGNSGVYLQNRYEIQVLDGDTTSHGMAAVINESKLLTLLTTGWVNGIAMTLCFEGPALKMESLLSNQWLHFTLMEKKRIQIKK
jgi:hypothetical protein